MSTKASPLVDQQPSGYTDQDTSGQVDLHLQPQNADLRVAPADHPQVPDHPLLGRVRDFMTMRSDDYEKKYAEDDKRTQAKIDSVLGKVIPFYKQASELNEPLEKAGKTKLGGQVKDFVNDQLSHPEQLAMGGEFGSEGLNFEGAEEGVKNEIGKLLNSFGKQPLHEQHPDLRIVPEDIITPAVAKGPKETVEGQGLKYKGELTPGSDVHMIEHPDHPGKTAALKAPITPERVTETMQRKLKEFGIEPAESPVSGQLDANEILKAHEEKGGSTFNPKQGNLAGTDNYAVAAHPQRGELVKGELTPERLNQFIDKNQDLLKDERNSIGTWKDENGDHALDVVHTIPDRDEAIALGKKNNQKAIFNLKTGEEIPTGGTGEVATAQAERHPILQKLEEKYGTSDSADGLKHEASFINPEGQFIHLGPGGDHDMAIAKASAARPGAAAKRNFTADSGTIRLRLNPRDRAGATLHITVPEGGVTEDQIPALRQALAQVGRYGNLVMERSDANTSDMSMSKEFARPADMDNYLRQIQAHPDQAKEGGDIVSGARARESMLPIPYELTIKNPDGTYRTETVEAHSVEKAMKQAEKQFPGSDVSIVKPSGQRTPSTGYSVPTGKILSGPPRENITATIRHEFGHSLIGEREGIGQRGMVRHTHPDASGKIVAGIVWKGEDVYEPGRYGVVKQDRMPSLIKTLMGGIAADEVFNDVPRSENINMNSTIKGSDANLAMNFLKQAGFDTIDAAKYVHKMIDDNLEYLRRPEISGIIKENEGVREPDLSSQYHYSDERLHQMHLEAQRRINESGNYETGGTARDTNRGANVAGTEGKATGTDQGESEEIISAAKRKHPEGSSVPLYGAPLKIPGVKAGDTPMVVDVARTLSNATKKDLGALKLGKADSDEMVKRAAELGEDEARYQLATDNSGETWYQQQMRNHDSTIQKIRPELSDPSKLSLFHFAEAVLSSGQKPYGNTKAAIRAWDAYQDTGKFPRMNPETEKSWGPRGQAAYGNAFDMINSLIEKYGEEGASKWLLEDHPVKELREYNKLGVSGKNTDMKPGAYILGAKRGPFGLNLHGIETEFTADMWVSRTWNRWMGTAEVGKNPDGIPEILTDAPRNDTERKLMKESFQKIAQKFDKSTSQMQAVLWYYEQGLYRAHGLNTESWSFEDAAKRAAKDLGPRNPQAVTGKMTAGDFLKAFGGLGKKE